MNLRKYLSSVRDYDVDDVLGTIGLQKRASGDWVFPMLAGLGAGMAIGAGLAFFLTPYRGDEAREKVIKGASDAQKALTEKVAMLTEKVQAMTGSSEVAQTAAPVAARPVIGTGTPTTPGGTGTTNRSY